MDIFNSTYLYVGNYYEISEKLDDDLNINQWVQFSKKTLTEFKKMLKPNGVAVFVIRDVSKPKNSVIPLARDFALMVKENKLFKNVWIFSDYIQGVDKTTRIWRNPKVRLQQLIEL